MTIQNYISNLNSRFKSGISTEHSYRGDLQSLISDIVKDVLVTNEPSRIACGAPDYIITKKDIPLGYIEAKDLGADLSNKLYKEQLDRYKFSLNNLIITDYLTFQLFIDGVFVTSISLGQIQGNKIIAKPENYDAFSNFIKGFCSHVGQTIKSSKKLAEMMAGKARLLSDIIEKSLTSDENNQEDSTLKDQMNAFKNILIHDITPKGFADVYAQTIAYGMFAARLHDTSINNFSRQEAAELIPKSNPFLRKLFGYIAGPDIDDRIKWVVNSLVDIFLACNVEDLLKDYGKATKTEDPIIHFYETFLSVYDPKLRKARGVWYTPHPVVFFIVRAIDYILKTEFNLPQGLADNSKTKIRVNLQETDKRYKDNIKTFEQEVHKVQILDPVTGTGTFIAEIVKFIYKSFEGQQGIWSNYVENHLLPRLNGFEILMASYAMAHLKLDLLLSETGYKPTSNQRFRIFLTNSLEEQHQDTGTLWANWLSAEANEANHIKRDTPVMVIAGNPPYSGESSNKGEWMKWIDTLMEDYKKEPGGKEKLKEKNSKWINDDYVKFLRYGQYFIEKNGSGILAFINPHGFLDNPTFRGMRWHLLKTYDKIYIIDLHGNTKKKEVCPDGSKDENVFDIQQGVSINLFIKTGKKKANELGKIFHFDLFGKRDFKYDFLLENSLESVAYKELPNIDPNYFFVGKNFEEQKKYNKGFSLSELFKINGTGIVTKRDNLCINESKEYCYKAASDILSLPKNEFYNKYKLPEDVRDWRYDWATKDIADNKLNIDFVKKINYRPFDTRFTYYTGRSRGFMGWPVTKIMQHFLNGDNLGLSLCKQFKTGNSYQHVLISNKIIESSFVSNRTSEITSTFPLYLYPEKQKPESLSLIKEDSESYGNSDNDNDLLSMTEEARLVYKTLPYRLNLNWKIVRAIEKKLGITFIIQQFNNSNDEFGEVDILDYIYAVLHSPTYREKYKEFLKIDFPRIPYPKDQQTFWQLVKLGGELRQIHLLKSPIVEKYITQYPTDGDNTISQAPKYIPKPKKNDTGALQGDVYINSSQYFANVPLLAWNFYIGGYQPAQKWLKDRKGRTLGFEDILHYQKIIVALNETDRLMKEIDKINIE